MAGFVFTHDGDEFQFHNNFPNINPGNVTKVQLDCDELLYGLRVWPEADLYRTHEEGSGRVRTWHGASARRMACKLLDHQFATHPEFQPTTRQEVPCSHVDFPNDPEDFAVPYIL